ncbi:MAG: GTPase Era [Spirochaetia bacterium]|nr:GTPase Era [Spirochaetia bacterium]MCF7942716.1 GTPase Era [Spirochaetia bacterium]
MKCATVSIIGRPSAGKSTLLNALCKAKVSITAPSPQTTRNSIRGILTEEAGQLIFIDTPGYHLSEKVLNQRLISIAESSLAESDIILYVVDALRPPGSEEDAILTLLRSVNRPCVVAANKMDLPGASYEGVRTFLQHDPNIRHILGVSAMDESGLEELKEALYSLAPEGEMLYPEEFYTDQPPEFRVSEIIREKVVNRVTQELPHSVYIDIADMELDDDQQKMWIRAFIIVERETQVGIIVGKKGSGIQEIRKTAQKEIAKLFPYKIHLDLRVKTQSKWRNNTKLLKRLIY